MILLKAVRDFVLTQKRGRGGATEFLGWILLPVVVVIVGVVLFVVVVFQSSAAL